MELKKAIEMLKMNRPLIGRIGDEVMEAIDTVVSHYEKSEKIELLKSAKQPSEITHPYDLSRK